MHTNSIKVSEFCDGRAICASFRETKVWWALPYQIVGTSAWSAPVLQVFFHGTGYLLDPEEECYPCSAFLEGEYEV